MRAYITGCCCLSLSRLLFPVHDNLVGIFNSVCYTGPPPMWLTGNLGEITRLSYAMYYMKYAPMYGKVWKVRTICALLFL